LLFKDFAFLFWSTSYDYQLWTNLGQWWVFWSSLFKSFAILNQSVSHKCNLEVTLGVCMSIKKISSSSSILFVIYHTHVSSLDFLLFQVLLLESERYSLLSWIHACDGVCIRQKRKRGCGTTTTHSIATLTITHNEIFRLRTA
jgi:hypothetical protein